MLRVEVAVNMARKRRRGERWAEIFANAKRKVSEGQSTERMKNNREAVSNAVHGMVRQSMNDAATQESARKAAVNRLFGK